MTAVVFSRKWRWTFCVACQSEHGLNQSGLLLVIHRAQEGALMTTGFQPLCILEAFNEPLPERLANSLPEYERVRTAESARTVREDQRPDSVG